mmetsp:Transcript_24095/g.54932  ORF Transcript_24095/g.54932 Transcript_24095/m.54932 type:complete len:206 (+) Transcript_24095:715-1332(+)
MSTPMWSTPLEHGRPELLRWQGSLSQLFRRNAVCSLSTLRTRAKKEVWSHAPFVIDPSGVFFRPETSGLFLTGFSRLDAIGWPDPDCVGDTEEIENADHELFEEVIWPILAGRCPMFESARMVGGWAGFYEVNPLDHNPVLGVMPEAPNLLFATGFSGHGMMQSPPIGRAVSELLLHGEFKTLDLSDFDIDRIRRNEPIVEALVV